MVHNLLYQPLPRLWWQTGLEIVLEMEPIMLKRLLPLCVIVTFSTALLAQDAADQQVPEQQTPQQQMPQQQQPGAEMSEQMPQEPAPGQMPEDMPDQPMTETPAADVQIPDDLSTPRSALKVLAQALETGDQEQIREVIHAETEAEERMKEATVNMAQAIGQLRRSAVSQWGAEGARALIGDVEGAMEEGMQRLAQAEEVIDNDTAVVTAADESTPPVTLRRVDEKWRVPMSELHQGVAADNLDQPLREMETQAQVVRQFAAEIRQYQSAEEAAQALRSRMMQAAMQPEDEEVRERPAAERQPPQFDPEQQQPERPQMPQQQGQHQPQQQQPIEPQQQEQPQSPPMD
jgi:hypothetical protein